MAQEKVIMLFTNSFPYGRGEQFIENEILYLCSYYKKVIITPYKKEGKRRKIPKNAIVEDFELALSAGKFSTISQYFHVFIRVYIYTLIKTQNRSKYFNFFFSDMKLLFHRIRLFSWVQNYAEKSLKNFDITFYSYWFNTWASALAILSSEDPTKKTISRIHQYDFELETHERGYFSFREFDIKYIKKIASISDYGVKYFLKTYPKICSDNKIFLSRLGVLANNNKNGYIDSNSIVVASCSSLEPRKRIDLIIEIFLKSKLKIHWIHFGHGPLYEEIFSKAKKLPKNITFNFKGHLKNTEVLEYYRCHQIDFFINVSRNEGIPVSIMEAISFGIPVIGCNVGGVSEIVNKETGYLISKNIEIKKVVDIFNNYLDFNFKEKEQIRKRIKSYWAANYSAEVNYKKFIEQLNNLYKCVE